jgi:succinate dehydrogenase / fumarate reductase membrane anchor subunit
MTMTVSDEPFEPGSDRGTGFGSFFGQSLSGAALLVLLTLHMIAQHFVVAGGLRDYAAVVAWLSNPAVVLIELAFLVFVAWHAMLGVRAILFDFGPSARVARAITAILWVVGLGSVAYGVWLVITIVNA